MSENGIVNVFVPREVHFDLKKMQVVTANILKRLGCEGCHSGPGQHAATAWPRRSN